MLDSKYDHKKVEEGKYETWKKEGYFTAGDTSKKPYSIVIPPPYVTGVLHLGHAMDTTLQDIIIRFKKMQGYDVLWLPGMDHAAIATEAKVVQRLKDKGINKYEYGREKFLEACWDWTNEHADTIRSQWAKLGLALDYTRERFTLDEGLNKAVTKVFVDFYKKGLIYRGEKIINWDPEAQTALSNEEVIYQDDNGAFYHLKYFIEGSDDYLYVATTRPETLFGDTAVALSDSNERKLDQNAGDSINLINALGDLLYHFNHDSEYINYSSLSSWYDKNEYYIHCYEGEYNGKDYQFAIGFCESYGEMAIGLFPKNPGQLIDDPSYNFMFYLSYHF